MVHMKKFLAGIIVIYVSLNLAEAGESLKAYIVDDVIKIPFLMVGESQYRLDLQIIPDTNPVELKLIDAKDITALALTFDGASTFNKNLLTIPTLTVGADSYKIEFLLISADPSVTLRLESVKVVEPDSVDVAATAADAATANTAAAADVNTAITDAGALTTAMTDAVAASDLAAAALATAATAENTTAAATALAAVAALNATAEANLTASTAAINAAVTASTDAAAAFATAAAATADSTTDDTASATAVLAAVTLSENGAAAITALSSANGTGTAAITTAGTAAIAAAAAAEAITNALNAPGIGDKVWFDVNRNGTYDLGEPGIPGVSMYLWVDTNADGAPDLGIKNNPVRVTDAEGQYRYSRLDPGTYNAFVWMVDNYGAGIQGPLAGMISSSNKIRDPNNDVDNDNNACHRGANIPIPLLSCNASGGGDISSGAVYLSASEEPINDGDALSIYAENDSMGNMTIDFGFHYPDDRAFYINQLLVIPKLKDGDKNYYLELEQVSGSNERFIIKSIRIADLGSQSSAVVNECGRIEIARLQVNGLRYKAELNIDQLGRLEDLIATSLTESEFANISKIELVEGDANEFEPGLGPLVNYVPPACEVAAAATAAANAAAATAAANATAATAAANAAAATAAANAAAAERADYAVSDYFGTQIPFLLEEPPEDFQVLDFNTEMGGQMKGLSHTSTDQPGAGKFQFHRVHRTFKHGLEWGQQFGVFGTWLASMDGNNTVEGGHWVNPKVDGPEYYPTLHFGGALVSYAACSDVGMGGGMYERVLGDRWLNMIQISNRVLYGSGVNVAFEKDQEAYLSDNGIWAGSGWSTLDLDHPRDFKFWMSFVETGNYQGPVVGYIPEYWNWLDPLFYDPNEVDESFASLADHGTRGNTLMANERINLKAFSLGDGVFYAPVPKLPDYKEKEYLVTHPQSISLSDMENYSTALKEGRLMDTLIQSSDRAYNAIYQSTHQQTKIYEDVDGARHKTIVQPPFTLAYDAVGGYVQWDHSTEEAKRSQHAKNGFLYLRKTDDKWEGYPWDSDEIKADPHYYKSEIIDAPDDIIRVPQVNHRYYNAKERDATHPDFANWDTTGKTRYTRQLQNGATVTYVWFKFIEQPAMLSAQQNHPETYTPEYLATLQSYIEALHAAVNANSSENPTEPVFINYRGGDNPDNKDPNLAKLASAQLVTPEEGFEVGYVPIIISAYHAMDVGADRWGSVNFNAQGLWRQPSQECSNDNWTDNFWHDLQ